MSTDVHITSTAANEYAAEVREDTETTNHHVVLTPARPRAEHLRPHELDPAAPVGQDAEFLPELRRRLGAE